jgi:hypothetical protein
MHQPPMNSILFKFLTLNLTSFFFLALQSQSILKSNNFRTVLPSSDIHIVSSLDIIPGTNLFLTTGDDNVRIWDLNSNKMLSKLVNSKLKRTTISYKAFFHKRYNLIAQLAFNSVSFYSFPDLKLVHYIEFDVFRECIFHENWDYFIITSKNSIEKVSLKDFTAIEKLYFNDGIPAIGFTTDSCSVYYEFENNRIGIASIENPLRMDWVYHDVLDSMEVVEILSNELFILENKILISNGHSMEINRNLNAKKYYFFNPKKNNLKEIEGLSSRPENTIISQNLKQIFLSGAKSCLIYSIDNYAFINSLTINSDPSNTRILGNNFKKSQKAKVNMLLFDQNDNLIWVGFGSGLAGFDAYNHNLKIFFPGDFHYILKIEKKLVLVDSNGKIFIIRDYKNDPFLREFKADFINPILKVKSSDEHTLSILTESGLNYFDLRKLEISKAIPMKNGLSLSTLENFRFWFGKYFCFENFNSPSYFIGLDSIEKINSEVLYYDNFSNEIFLKTDSSINRVGANEDISKAVVFLDFKSISNRKNSDSIDLFNPFKNSRSNSSILQIDPKQDWLYILNYKKAHFLSNFKLNRSRNDSLRGFNLLRLNFKNKNYISYRVPWCYSYVLPLQSACFLVKKDFQVFFNRNYFFNYFFNKLYKDKVVYDNGEFISTRYRIKPGSKIIGDLNGRLNGVPFFLVSDKNRIVMVSIPSFKRKILWRFNKNDKNPEFYDYEFDSTRNKILLFSFHSSNLEIDLESGTVISHFKAHNWQQNSGGWLSNSLKFTANIEELKLWKNESKLFDLYLHKNNGFHISDTLGYYYSSKHIIKDLYFIDQNLKPIGFEQLDLLYNRPSIIQKSMSEFLGKDISQSFDLFHDLELRRLRHYGIDNQNYLGTKLVFPVVEFELSNDRDVSFNSGSISFQIRSSDSKYTLHRFNVFVNEVPLYGSKGISIAQLKRQSWDTTVSVPLSLGDNKIQVSVINELGLENFKYPIYIHYTPSKDSIIVPKTHFIGIGVNRFQNPGHDLNYCVKDVEDLSRVFDKDNAVVKLLTDNQATRENILRLKKYLRDSTTVHDKVVISCSSHGLLDDAQDFYLATHDVDFDNPKTRGLKYEELEGLLDSIPARKKLMLLDACNSGEIDKSMEQGKQVATSPNMQPTTAQGSRNLTFENAPSDQTSFQKMAELFVNVRNNTGSVIISAAGGTESALEGVKIDNVQVNNGAFTYAVLDFFKRHANTGHLTVNQLKQFVETRVEEITDGVQKPTSRQETMEVDWELQVGKGFK